MTNSLVPPQELSFPSEPSSESKNGGKRQGDVGVAGGLQRTEPANAHVVLQAPRVETLKLLQAVFLLFPCGFSW